MLTEAQVYIEKHKITALFEDLMNKLVRNAPENPVIYLIKQLYKKAGLDVPRELKPMTEPRRGSLNLTVFGQSSEIISKSAALASWSAKPGETHPSSSIRRDRSVAKSWQSPEKLKASGEVHFSKTTKPVKGQKSEDKKEKTSWNSLTKITTSSFDEFATQTKGSNTKKTKGELVSPMKDVQKSWAITGLDEADNKETTCYDPYNSLKYIHNKKNLSEEDVWSDELSLTPSLKSYISECSDDTLSKSTCTTYTPRRGKCKVFISGKHKEELEELIMKENQRKNLEEPTLITEKEELDAAIELLENPRDLKSEGVTSLSSAGFKLSKTLRERENSQVRLNIKLYPSASDIDSMISESNCFRENRRDIDQESLATSYRFDDSDDNIESASQISANTNKRYQWNSADSEEAYISSPSTKRFLYKQHSSKSLNSFQISPTPKPNYSVPLPATSPMAVLSKKAKTREPYQQESQMSLNREQLQRLKTSSSGWNVAPESDTSILSSYTNRF